MFIINYVHLIKIELFSNYFYYCVKSLLFLNRKEFLEKLNF